ncbi:MAG TPA: hypothetical protein VK399_11495, partial [Longimicrobiaceae bacterium]|nr:hypothetical protein [Longimicrobiaceae bacterium]
MAHPTGPYLGKDLVGLEDLSAEQITAILDTSEPFKEISERAIKKTPVLRGKTIVNAFFENSTRTRISFEFAQKRLSADTVNFAAGGSSVTKGETLVDTARNLEAMRIDMVVIRHGASGAARFLGERIASNVVNAFFENSTRTRVSFEFAEKRMGADTVSISTTGSSVQKGETLVDTARNLEAMRIDMVV